MLPFHNILVMSKYQSNKNKECTCTYIAISFILHLKILRFSIMVRLKSYSNLWVKCPAGLEFPLQGSEINIFS